MSLPAMIRLSKYIENSTKTDNVRHTVVDSTTFLLDYTHYYIKLYYEDYNKRTTISRLFSLYLRIISSSRCINGSQFYLSTKVKKNHEM